MPTVVYFGEYLYSRANLSRLEVKETPKTYRVMKEEILVGYSACLPAFNKSDPRIFGCLLMAIESIQGQASAAEDKAVKSRKKIFAQLAPFLLCGQE